MSSLESFSNTPAKGGMFKNVTTSAPSSSSGPSVLRADTDFDYKGVLEYSQSGCYISHELNIHPHIDRSARF